jgi:RHS repeat-associated protein
VVVRRKKRLSRKPDVWRYAWDTQDRLVEVTTPDGTKWVYRYDPFGRRVAKQRFAPDGETVVEEVTFAWDGFALAEQVVRTDDRAPRCTVWDWEPDRFSPVTQVDRVALAERPQDWVDDPFYSIVTDLVGTPTELVDEQGELAWRARSTVWGAPFEDTGTDEAYCPLRFPGQYRDPESALNYDYYRHYDPETGQYASLDPLGLAPGPNPRAYVPNPFTAVDPLGLAPDCETAARDAARRRAQKEQDAPTGQSKKTRPTSAAGLSVPGHETPFTGANVKGGADAQPNLHPAVRDAYDRAPAELRERGRHGKCGEAEALSEAMQAGVDPRGGVMAAVEVRAAGNAAHQRPKEACDLANSCLPA